MAERAQVKSTVSSYEPKSVAVANTDTYVKPAPLTREQVFTPLGEFLATLSPTIKEYAQKAAQVKAELESQAILEKMAPRTVGDINKIFADTESFHKYVDDYNSLTVTGQQNMGKILGVKYSEETKLAIQDTAKNENWMNLKPQDYADKVNAATRTLLAERKATNPEAFMVPNFTSSFATSMEQHNNSMITAHIQEHGRTMERELGEQMSTIAFDITNMIGTSQEKANALAMTIDEKRPALSSIDLNNHIIRGIASSENLEFLEDSLRNKATISVGGHVLNNTYTFKTVVRERIIQLKTKKFDEAARQTQAYVAATQWMKMKFETYYAGGGPKPTVAELRAAHPVIGGAAALSITRGTGKSEFESYKNLFPKKQSILDDYTKRATYILSTKGAGSPEYAALESSMSNSLSSREANEVVMTARGIYNSSKGVDAQACLMKNKENLTSASKLPGVSSETKNLALESADMDATNWIISVNAGNFTGKYFDKLSPEDINQLKTVTSHGTSNLRPQADTKILADLWEKAFTSTLKEEDAERAKTVQSQLNKPQVRRVFTPTQTKWRKAFRQVEEPYLMDDVPKNVPVYNSRSNEVTVTPINHLQSR